MDTTQCKLVQDMMPLRIDEACSEETTQFVDEHISQCPACAEVYGYMRATLPNQNEEKKKKEEEEFRVAMRQMKKTLNRKRLRYILLGLLTALTAYALLFMLLSPTRALPLSQYKVQLETREDGRVLQVWDHGPSRHFGHINSIKLGDILYLSYTTSTFGQRTGEPGKEYIGSALSLVDGKLYMMYDGEKTVHPEMAIREVRQGSQNQYKLIYTAGDALPKVDEQALEHAYYSQDISAPSFLATPLPFAVQVEQPTTQALPVEAPEHSRPAQALPANSPFATP